MATATKSGQNLSFTYNADGLRTTKTVNGVVHTYYYSGSKLVRETYGDYVLDFFYDQNGTPFMLLQNGNIYYYITNTQGDVIRLVDINGNVAASYRYDPYGKATSALGSHANINPLRYRGYVFDHETGLYYLQSRYYDPETGRFLNADNLISTGQGLLGNNMFAYCLNNPACRKDIWGTTSQKIFEGESDLDPTDDNKDIDGGKMSDGGSGGTGDNGGTGGSSGTGGNNGYTPPDGGGGVTDSIQVDGTTVTFGHGGRHLSGSSLTTGEVNSSIAHDVVGRNLSPNQFLPNGTVTVGEYRIGYTAYMLSDTLINVGTYHII